MQVWIAGRYHGNLGEHIEGLDVVAWDFEGVYTTEEQAVAACKGSNECFVGPWELNKEALKEREQWPGCYYPHAEPNGGEKEQGV